MAKWFKLETLPVCAMGDGLVEDGLVCLSIVQVLGPRDPLIFRVSKVNCSYGPVSAADLEQARKDLAKTIPDRIVILLDPMIDVVKLTEITEEEAQKAVSCPPVFLSAGWAGEGRGVGCVGRRK